MKNRSRLPHIRSLLCVVSLLLTTATASAQEWLLRVPLPGADSQETVGIVTDGTDFYVAGSALNANGNWDIVLARVTAAGDTAWIRQWDLGADEKAGQMMLDDSGGLILALTRYERNGSRAHLARWTKEGIPAWQRELTDGVNRTCAGPITRLSSGNTVCAFASYGTAGNRCGIAGVSPNGVMEWTRYFDEIVPRALAPSGFGFVIAVSSTTEPILTRIHQYTSEGIALLADFYSGPGTGRTLPIGIASGEEGFFVGGTQIEADGTGTPFVLHTTHSGARMWVVDPISSAGAHRLVDIAPFPGGGAVIAVRAGTPGGTVDTYIARLGTDGDRIWEHTIDRPGNAVDTRPPLFSGVMGIAWSESKADVFWAPAGDDVSTTDDIIYNIYTAATPGGQDFDTPDQQIVGNTSAMLGGWDPGARVYVVVRAEDEAGNEESNKRELLIEVPGEPLRILTPAVVDLPACAPVSVQLEAGGGIPPYFWIRASGELPLGLAWSTDGRIEGSSSESGDYPVHVRVRDSAGDTASTTILFRVLPAPRLNVAADTTLPAGTACYSTIIVASGAKLTFDGPVTLKVQDSLIVDGAIVSDCDEIVFTGFSHALVRGSIDNRCTTPSTGIAGGISFISETGSFEFHGDTASIGIRTDGDLRLIPAQNYRDWEIAVPPDARAKTELAPVVEADADILNMPVTPGDTIDVLFTLTGADPDGGPVRFDIDFGDGTTRRDIPTEDGAHAWVEKSYDRSGNYTVGITVRDDESHIAAARLQLFIGDSLSDGSDGIGLSAGAGDVVHRISDSIRFDFAAGLGAGVSVASVRWEFGDGQISMQPEGIHRYSQPGRYEISCLVNDDSGNVASATASVYLYEPDTTVMTFAGTELSRTAAQGNTAVIDGPMLVTRRVVFHGYQHLSFERNANVRTKNGATSLYGAVGRPGSGISAWSPGWLVVNGGTIRAGSGGFGGMNTAQGSFGKRGGNGGSLQLSGRNVLIAGGTIAAGDGGDGGSSVVFKEAPGTAHAVGGNGGDAGGHVRIRATNSVTFLGATSIHTGNGGKGGNAVATGGSGKNKCNLAEDGANAIARGGNGGKARKRGTVTGNVTGMHHVSLSGGQGGNGGDGTASAGKGGSAESCESTAVGGKGGYAIAWGGDGGDSGHSGVHISGADSFKPGDAGDATATPGRGGDASAIPRPEQGQDGCPGEAGGDAMGRGGSGGRGFASNGHKGKLSGSGIQAQPGSSTVNGSSGGSGAARGGTGGNGTHCDCDGGRGGNAVAFGGLRGEVKTQAVDGGVATAMPGADGNALTLGGTGGNGGHCCTPPAPVGGDGAAGGNATSSPGPTGEGTAVAGDGGNGGDGKGPGAGGPGGTATVNGNAVLELDGNDGEDGEWCFLIESWYIYYSSVPDGSILPGTDVTLGTYTAKDLAAQSGTITVHFMTPAEAGGMPASYLKLGSEVYLESGGMTIDFTSIQDVVQPGRHWDCSKYAMTFSQTGMMMGIGHLLGYSGGTLIAEKEIPLDPLNPLHAESITAPEGQFFDTVSFVSNVPVSFEHWSVEIVVVDP